MTAKKKGNAAVADKTKAAMQATPAPQAPAQENPPQPPAPVQAATPTPAQVQKADESIKNRLQPGSNRKLAGEDNKYSYSGQGDGMRSNADKRGQVLAFFEANPGQAFTYKEVAAKCDISAHHAWTSTRDLEDLGDLVEAKSPRSNKKAHKLNPNYESQEQKPPTDGDAGEDGPVNKD